MKSWCPWVARAGFHGGVAAQQERRWHIRAERLLGSPLPRSPLIDKMVRVLVLLSLVCCATAQFGFFQGRGPQRRPQQRRPQGQNQLRQGGGGVDDRHGSSEYHFSWRHDGGRDYTGQQAFGYCSGLGGGWSPVSINDGSEDNFVNSVIRGERQKYIWTGGSKRGGGWAWADGSGVQGINWSHTGGNQRPQPDNRDRNEDCLAVLNNFYGDGIKWHDVGCSHRKPTICERRG